MDLVLRGDLLNVATEEIIENCYLGIEGSRISCISESKIEGRRELDLSGLLMVPGLIDSHIHVESTMLTLSNLARMVLPHGTTALITDLHEIANVLGVIGIRLLMEESFHVPLRVYFTVPSCVPASRFESSGARIGLEEISELIQWDRVVGLGELMDVDAVLRRDRAVEEKVRAARIKRIDGHAPGLDGLDLCRYVSIGVETDHEVETRNQAIERLRMGLKIIVREGSVSRDLERIFPLQEKLYERCMLASDDLSPRDIAARGHMDYAIRKAIELGVDPIKAIKMCTLVPAEHYNLRDVGGLFPGRFADIIALRNLEKFEIDRVFFGGRLVVERGRLIEEIRPFHYPTLARRTMRARRITERDLEIPCEKRAIANIIEVYDDRLTTGWIKEEPRISGGLVISDPERDILKAVVVNRYGEDRIALGLVRGFGLEKGAMASSIAHDSHNIVAVGVEDRDIVEAVNAVIDAGGGLCASLEGKITILELPIAGLLSEDPPDLFLEKLDKLESTVEEMGSKLRKPFMVLSFLSLSVIPELRLTDRGLLDVRRGRYVPLIEG